jgi:ABC-type multidrug transport system permease subunit
MTLRKKLKDPRFQLSAGLIFLGIASLAKWFLQPASGLPEDWTDGVVGLLYGISIGLMLLGIWRNSRDRRHSR